MIDMMVKEIRMTYNHLIGAIAAASVLAGNVAATASPSAIGSWRGTYTCLQGRTALELTVSKLQSGQLAAVFEFGPLPNGPTIPTGCYVVVGTEGGSGHISFSPNSWLSRPADRSDGTLTHSYKMVGLDGMIDPDNATFHGEVTDAAGCAAFTLTRIIDAERPTAPCTLPKWS